MLKNKAVCFGICHHFALQLFFPLSFDHVLFSPCLPPSHFSSVWSSVLQGVLAGWFWELMGAAQSLSLFPNRLDTDIGQTPVSAVVLGLACSLLIEGCWLFWKQDMSFCFLVRLVQESLSFSQTLASCRSGGYWLFIPICWYFSICGDILLPTAIVWVCSLVFTCWKFCLQRPMLIKIEIRAFGKQLSI